MQKHYLVLVLVWSIQNPYKKAIISSSKHLPFQPLTTIVNTKSQRLLADILGLANYIFCAGCICMTNSLWKATILHLSRLARWASAFPLWGDRRRYRFRPPAFASYYTAFGSYLQTWIEHKSGKDRIASSLSPLDAEYDNSKSVLFKSELWSRAQCREVRGYECEGLCRICALHSCILIWLTPHMCIKRLCLCVFDVFTWWLGERVTGRLRGGLLIA